jgi:hypothetical protein
MKYAFYKVYILNVQHLYTNFGLLIEFFLLLNAKNKGLFKGLFNFFTK